MFDRYCAEKTRAKPISTDHCMSLSKRASAVAYPSVPTAGPKPMYDAQGKNGKRPRPAPATRYSFSSGGAPPQGRLLITGASAATVSAASRSEERRVGKEC